MMMRILKASMLSNDKQRQEVGTGKNRLSSCAGSTG